MKRVLVTARIFGHVSDQSFDIFKTNGIEVVPNPHRGKRLYEDALIALIGGVDGLLTGVDEVTSKVIHGADKLKVISKFGTGVDNIDVTAATEKGIVVTNAPGMNSDAVADMTFALMLAAARKIPFAFTQVQQEKWPLIIGTGVWGKSLGIIGLGEIGKRVALRANGFNMEVMSYEKFPDENFIREQNIKLVSLEQLLQTSDFVSIHVPLTDETRHLIGAAEIELMKPTAIMINTARGGIVNEEALYNGLRSGKPATAAFDVLKEEPPADRSLLDLDNFIITPHISPFTKEAIGAAERLSAQNLIDVLNGRYPANIVNSEVLKKT
jgi:D-3-phosphoglycerate dehydrogenase